MATWHAIVTILPGGQEIRIARTALSIFDSRTGRRYQYESALAEVDLPAIAPGPARGRVAIPSTYLSVPALRDAGILLAGAEAEIALWRRGDDWRERRILLTGRVEPNGVTRDDGITTLDLADYAPQMNRQFPPAIFTREGFANLNENDAGRAMNVLYGGPITDVPVVALDPYSDDASVTSIRLAFASHRIGLPSVRVRPKGTDVITAEVKYVFDHASGATVAYVALSPAQLAGSSDVVIDANGHAKNGAPVRGLGDVIEHLLVTYSGLPEERIDYERLAFFIPRANRLAVASMFGGDAGGTLFGILQQRYQEPLGIRLDWRNGKFGADLLAMDPFEPIVSPLRVGFELVERIAPIEYATQGGDEPYSSFTLEYDPNSFNLNVDGNPAFRGIARRNAANDERCAEAQSRFGLVPFPLIQVPDVNLAASADVVLDWTVDRRAVQRTRTAYLAALSDVIDLPILRRYALTDDDPQTDWTDEPFRIESIQPREDDLAEVVVLSYRASV